MPSGNNLRWLKKTLLIKGFQTNKRIEKKYFATLKEFIQNILKKKSRSLPTSTSGDGDVG
jgi:hypothetical protein